MRSKIIKPSIISRLAFGFSLLSGITLFRLSEAGISKQDKTQFQQEMHVKLITLALQYILRYIYQIHSICNQYYFINVRKRHFIGTFIYVKKNV